MVRRQLEARDIKNPAVLEAMRTVPRHLFVPEELRPYAYDDGPLQLGPEQSISQPYIVAEMIQHLNLSQKNRVLEIGTGSGYEAAILSKICTKVYTIEIDPLLARWAEIVFKKLEISNIRTRVRNGYEGWSEESPFDGIIVSAACSSTPQKLIDQLIVGGRLIYPEGIGHQVLVLLEKTQSKLRRELCGSVRFVQMQD